MSSQYRFIKSFILLILGAGSGYTATKYLSTSFESLELDLDEENKEDIRFLFQKTKANIVAPKKLEWFQKADDIFPSGSIIDAFNNPKDCVRNMFPGNLDSNVFKKPYSVKNPDNPIFTEEEVFDNLDTQKPEIGCFLFNGQEGKQFRIELSFKRGDRGYAWMFGSRKTSENKTFSTSREILFKKEGEIWKVFKGQDVLIWDKVDKTKKDQVFYWPKLDSSIKSFSRDIKTHQKCDEKTNKCDFEEIISYWKPSEETSAKKLSEISTNTGEWILFLSANKGTYEKRYIRSYRKSIFINDKWHSDLEPSAWKERKFLGLERDKWSNLKGVWKDSFDLCSSSNSGDADDKKSICKTPS